MNLRSFPTVLILSLVIALASFGSAHLGDGRGWAANAAGWLLAVAFAFSNVGLWTAYWKEVIRR